MGKYSIKELEQLSGIKAHTIRIWEKRHKIIEPQRTTTNIRLYSDEDLKKIINVSLLNNNGIKISKIVDMSLDEMNEKVLEISKVSSDATIHIDQLVVAMIDMEEELFEKILNTLILRYTFERTIFEIVYPFLEKIGVLWQTRNITPAHEHFISNLIRQKLIVAIDGLPIPPKSAKKIVLFLPEGELHEIGLLFYNFLARQAGNRTYYLGQSVPHMDLASVVAVHHPNMMITAITTSMITTSENYLSRLAFDFPAIKIMALGAQLQHYKGVPPDSVQIISTIFELKQVLQ